MRSTAKAADSTAKHMSSELQDLRKNLTRTQKSRDCALKDRQHFKQSLQSAQDTLQVLVGEVSESLTKEELNEEQENENGDPVYLNDLFHLKGQQLNMSN